jgi:ComF family protein
MIVTTTFMMLNSTGPRREDFAVTIQVPSPDSGISFIDGPADSNRAPWYNDLLDCQPEKDFMVNNWINNIQNLFFPGFCLVCGRKATGGRDLCSRCAAGLAHNHTPCRCCALPLPETSQPGSCCGECQNHQRPYDKVTAPYLYEGEIRHLHRAFKFHRKLSAGRLLSDLLCDAIEARGETTVQLLIPVPLHPSRVRQRGFNQAMEIARIASGRFGIPVDQSCIRRTAATAPQSGLTKRERIENIRGAFAMKRPVRAEQVAIIDDVMTTGMTIEQVARVLRLHGVRRIDAWVVARRP